MDTLFIWMLSMAPSLSVLTGFDHPLGEGEGYSPIKVTGAARQKMLRTPLKGTRILFYGCVPNSFQPLRDTKSTTTNYITGTANFNSNLKITCRHFVLEDFLKVLSQILPRQLLQQSF